MVGEKLFPFMKKKKKKNDNNETKMNVIVFFFFSLDSSLDFSIRHNTRAVQERLIVNVRRVNFMSILSISPRMWVTDWKTHV